MKHSHKISDFCKCRYCLAQISKGRRNQAEESVVYCPRLLFSNDKSQITPAILDLFENPSNQFRLYVDSVITSPTSLGSFKSKIAPVLVKIIAHDETFQNFISFQLNLLNQVDIDKIDIEMLNSKIYESDIQSLLPTKSISSLPDYLKVLMAMSLRDSSFVISISYNRKESNYWKRIHVDDIINYYRIDIIDLDIKPLDKLQKYIEEIKVHG